MSKQFHTTPDENWDQFLLTEKPSVLNRLGRKLGGVFLSAKNVAKEKYFEVTQGINSRIDEESQLIWEEAQEQMFEQAQHYENAIKKLKWRCVAISTIALIIGAIAGAVATVAHIL